MTNKLSIESNRGFSLDDYPSSFNFILIKSEIETASEAIGSQVWEASYTFINPPDMDTQYQWFRQHLGCWEGWFTTYDPDTLTITNRKQSIITFAEVQPGVMQQTNEYPSLDPQPAPQSWLYQQLSPGIRFFPDGSFSNGRLQYVPISDFGIEQGFLYQPTSLDHPTQKIRVVQLYNKAQPTGFIVIEEVRGDWYLNSAVDYELTGQWAGESVTFQADQYSSTSQSINFSISSYSNRIKLHPNLWLSSHQQLPTTSQQDRHFQLEQNGFPIPPIISS